MYVVTVTFEVAADHLEAFNEAMELQARTSLEVEPGCLRFDVCHAPERPQSIFLYEVYSDEAAFQSHLASEHFKAFDQRTAPWVVSKSVKTYVRHKPQI